MEVRELFTNTNELCLGMLREPLPSIARAFLYHERF